MKHTIHILEEGILTTIQDRGRFGFMQYGVTPAGAMDSFSMSIANLLAGNSSDEAVFETMYANLRIEFSCDETIAITGACAKAFLNHSPIPLWQSLEINKGDILTIQPPSSGIYNYIAFSRGLDIPEIMGSKSTHLRSGLGGWKGRALQKGDVIPLGDTKKESPRLKLNEKKIPVYTKEKILRVLLGPQDDHFTDEGIQTFLHSVYTITSQSDRMGYRLKGSPVSHRTSADIISDGNAHGSVQVPGNAQPIVLMSDRGTTGGYTKIATIITEDICTLSQMPPGSKVYFKAVTEKEANALYRRFFKEMKESLMPIRDPMQKIIMVTIDKKEYSVEIKQLE